MGEPFVLAPYRLSDDPEALALERACAQGSRYRMSFRRPTFRRRAENFADHRLVTARIEGKLVGIGAVAFKDVVVAGEPLRAGFGFDARVHPEHRRCGIGHAIGEALEAYGGDRLDLVYAWCIDDNRAMRALAKTLGVRDVGGYAYLVYPTYRDLVPARSPREATLDEVHRMACEVGGPFDFYTDPRAGGRLDGHTGSWLLSDGRHRAGCSAWDNAQILSEVIESLPLPLRLARTLTTAPGLSRLRWPHIPQPGEALKSWYLFDAFATDPGSARDLIRHVAAEARSRGIDYCYVVHGATDEWVSAVRADLPRPFAPRVPYRLLIRRNRGTVAPLERIYVDVRDL